MCDYIVLDLPQNQDGSYDRTSYAFLRGRNTGGVYLFTIGVPNGDMSATLLALNTQSFETSANDAQGTLPLRGFGILGSVHALTAGTQAADVQAVAPLFNRLYARLYAVATALGVPQVEVANFFAFKPISLVTRRPVYAELMAVLQNTTVNLVIVLAITSEHYPVVQASSAWSSDCLSQGNETTMEDAVRLIRSVSTPTFNFSLALSLRLDLFVGLSTAFLRQSRLGHNPCAIHRATFYAEQCERQVYGRDPAGNSIVYFDGGGCGFARTASGTDTVVSFDTPTTVARKMVNAYRALGYANTATHVMGWSMYNFSGGLGPASCHGGHDRIDEVHRVLREN